MKILVWYYWRSRSESAFIDVIYSVGVIPVNFFKLSGKVMDGRVSQKFRNLRKVHLVFADQLSGIGNL